MFSSIISFQKSLQILPEPSPQIIPPQRKLYNSLQVPQLIPSIIPFPLVIVGIHMPHMAMTSSVSISWISPPLPGRVSPRISKTSEVITYRPRAANRLGASSYQLQNLNVSRIPSHLVSFSLRFNGVPSSRWYPSLLADPVYSPTTRGHWMPISGSFQAMPPSSLGCQ